MRIEKQRGNNAKGGDFSEAESLKSHFNLVMSFPHLQIWIRICVHLLLFITLGVHSSKFDVNPVTDDISRLSVLVRRTCCLCALHSVYFAYSVTLLMLCCCSFNSM